MKIDFVTIVWGTDYIDLYLMACLPSQVHGDNGDCLASLDSRYIIYTDAPGVDRISRSEAFQRLRSLGVETDIREMPEQDPSGHVLKKYDAISDIHVSCLNSARKNGRYFSWMIPDGMYPDGFFRSLVRAAEAGKKAIYGPGLRVEKSALCTALEALSDDQGTSEAGRALKPDRLLRLGLPHIHPITQSLVVEANPSSTFPSMVYFETADGLIAKHFHLHPFLLWLDPAIDFEINGTLDSAGFLDHLQVREEEIALSGDSADCLWVLEISDLDHQLTRAVERQPLSPFKVAAWAHAKADDLQKRLFFNENFVFRTSTSCDIDPETQSRIDWFDGRCREILDAGSPFFEEAARLRQERRELGALRRERVDLRQVRNTLTEERNGLRRERQRMNSEISDLRSLRNTLIEERNSLRLDRQRMNKEISELRQELTERKAQPPETQTVPKDTPPNLGESTGKPPFLENLLSKFRR